jgi:hypothetical protein
MKPLTSSRKKSTNAELRDKSRVDELKEEAIGGLRGQKEGSGSRGDRLSAVTHSSPLPEVKHELLRLDVALLQLLDLLLRLRDASWGLDSVGASKS